MDHLGYFKYKCSLMTAAVLAGVKLLKSNFIHEYRIIPKSCIIFSKAFYTTVHTYLSLTFSVNSSTFFFNLF